MVQVRRPGGDVRCSTLKYAILGAECQRRSLGCFPASAGKRSITSYSVTHVSFNERGSVGRKGDKTALKRCGLVGSAGWERNGWLMQRGLNTRADRKSAGNICSRFCTHMQTKARQGRSSAAQTARLSTLCSRREGRRESGKRPRPGTSWHGAVPCKYLNLCRCCSGNQS